MTLHLAQYIEKEMARIRRDEDASQCSDVQQNHLPSKRRKLSDNHLKPEAAENVGSDPAGDVDMNSGGRASRSRSNNNAAVDADATVSENTPAASESMRVTRSKAS